MEDQWDDRERNEIGITFLEVLSGSLNEFQRDELKTSFLKTGDNVTNESTLDTIGLNHEGE